ncbi:MAG: glycosyltransferase family 2 protein [Pseudomonadota bacterium]|nr:glycosyltransferase family 2 protein [Pseudomonadota bacterium]
MKTRPLDPSVWRERFELSPPVDPKVVFLVPLIAASKANDWNTVGETLRRTLDSLVAQSDPNWCAVVCGQDKPENFPEDPRIQFVRYPVGSGRSYDKRRKQDFALFSKEVRSAGDGYLFFLDADDIMHPELVEYIRSDNNGTGYLIEKGFIWDVGSNAIAPLLPAVAGSKQKTQPFYMQCGSSCAVRVCFDKGDLALLPLLMRDGHQTVQADFGRYGLSLEAVPFSAALYVVFHGDNMRLHRGKLDRKRSYFDAYKVDSGTRDTILQSFFPVEPKSV